MLRVLDRLNWLVVAILASPFHWILSPGLMLLTITGRKTGNRYTIPVGYHELGDVIVVMVSDAANRSWWRNFWRSGPVEIRLRGKLVPARAQVVRSDDGEFRNRAEQVFRRARFIARIFGIRFDPDLGLRPDQVKALAEYAAIVRITPSSTPEGRPGVDRERIVG